ncbi:MAG: hypothetical protein AAB551_03935 [Patescibacteria group bacterium]
MADDQKNLKNDDFEVETPEEAQRGIAEQIGDAVGDAVPSLQGDKDEFPMQGGFFSQLGALLRMAGLSFKKIASCLVLLIVIGGGIFYVLRPGFSLFSKISSFVDSVRHFSLSSSDTSNEIQKTGLGIDHDFDFDSNFTVGAGRGVRGQKVFSSSLQNAYVFGVPHAPKTFVKIVNDLLDIGYFYGYRGISSDRLESYISYLSSINSGLSTDTHALLDASSKRSETLDRFIRDLQSLQEIAVQIRDFLAQEIATYTLQFDENAATKKGFEIAFFDHVNRFEPRGSHTNLDSFIDAAREGVNIKAQLLALRKVKAFYDAALPKLDTKIRDLQFNRDALIQNVTVVDVKNSDLKLIVPESQRLEQ